MATIHRRSLLMTALLLAATFAYVAAFLLRFEFALPRSMAREFRLGLLIFIPAKALVFFIFRLHENKWKLVSVFDLYQTVIANIAGSALAVAVTVLTAGTTFPRSIYAMDAALCVLATAGLQFSVRVYREVFAPRRADKDASKTILIYGAGTAGVMLAKEIRSRAKLGFVSADFSTTTNRRRAP